MEQHNATLPKVGSKSSGNRTNNRRGGLALLKKHGRKHYAFMASKRRRVVAGATTNRLGTPMTKRKCGACRTNALARSNKSGFCRDCVRAHGIRALQYAAKYGILRGAGRPK